MTTNESVVQELREMFRCGATPSRLLRHIVDRHPNEDSWHALIQDYFLEAFNVGIVRGLQVKDDYSHCDLRHFFLNKDVLHEMIQTAEQWTTCASTCGGSEANWFDRLDATTYEERIKEFETTPRNELSASWNNLTNDEREAINRVLAESKRKRESIDILAHLAERLQQRIRELEERVHGGSDGISPKT